jgi:hypothetical protein
MFNVFANGIARHRYHLDKMFADPGSLIDASQMLETLVEKTKVPLSGMGSGARKEAAHLASIVILEELKAELFWYSRKDARVTISYSNPGSLGGIIGSKYHGPEMVLFRDGGYEVGADDFVDMLKRMELNKWGYVRGILYALSGYSTHCETYGVKPCGVWIFIQINECK